MSATHRFSVKARLQYQVHLEGWLLLNIAAGKCGAQDVAHERLTSSSCSDVLEKLAPDGSTRFHGIRAPAGVLEVLYEAEVTRHETGFRGSWKPWEGSLVDLPPGVARYLYPSRYCESDKLVRFAMKEFGGLSSGHSRVAAICNWICDHIDYEAGATDAHSSAVDCLISRTGVCRDFAHLGISFARALGIPARYGSAYVHNLPVPDFHAFFEVWLEDRWWYYDATRMAPQAGFILIGTGHDAADTSVATMSAGVQFLSLQIDVTKLSAKKLSYTDSPISFGQTRRR